MGKDLEQSDSLSTCSDEELLTRFRGGQIRAFEALLRRYERELYGYLRRYLGDANLAEDVFQNTFFQVYQKIDQYEPGRRVRPWIYTIATHQAIDALRRGGRHQMVSLTPGREEDADHEANSLLDYLHTQGPSPMDRLQAEERVKQVRAGIALLPEHLRSVVVMAYYQGLKYREIAEALEIPVGTVKSRLHAALLRLQEAWRQSDLS
jgi:RNA polymerase sigma-70 factor (ECF subfamily)